jgi:Ice-binding-like/PEP-CTERM motif
MRCKKLTLLAIFAFAVFPLQAKAAINLGTAGNFAVLGGSTVTNTGSSVIDGGDVGLSPGPSITGFPPGIVTPPFTIHATDAVAGQAQIDLTSAYNAAANLPPSGGPIASELGGQTLFPGVYAIVSSAGLTGKLTLDAQGNPNAQFVFQIGSTLTTASNSSVVVINGSPAAECHVFWQVGSSATLGTGTAFAGHILALASITMTTGASILEGSALARNGAVTLDSNHITNCAAEAPIPEPATTVLFLIGAALLGLHASRGHTKSQSSSATS